MSKEKEQVMGNIYFFSGPYGCGKSTLANAFAKHLVNKCGKQQVYVIHGDDFHKGFIETDNKTAFFVDGQASNALLWKEILKFNWECILAVAGKALDRGLDVIIDYVIEGELPLVQELAKHNDAKLYYIVLTASQNAIRQRIAQRGDVDMVERALFLKKKLDSMTENQGHLFDNTDKSVEQELATLEIEKYEVSLPK